MILETKISGTFKDILTNTVATLLMGKQTKLQKPGDRDQKKRRNRIKERTEQCGRNEGQSAAS